MGVEHGRPLSRLLAASLLAALAAVVPALAGPGDQHASAVGSTGTVVPARLVDTRTGPNDVTFDGLYQGTGPTSAGGVLVVQVAGRAGVPGGATAAFLNLTTVDSVGPGYLTAYPCDRPRPHTSNVNFAPGAASTNAALAPLDAAGRLCLYTLTATNLIVDVSGYLAGPQSAVGTVVPGRLVDTRTGPLDTTVDGLYQGAGPTADGGVAVVQVAGRAAVPAGATAAFVNLTAADAAGPGFVTGYACDHTRPHASSLNYAPGAVATNAALVPLDVAGRLCLFTRSATDLIVDVTGYVTGHGGPVGTVPPGRLVDTRGGPGDLTVDGLHQGAGPTLAAGVVAVQVAGRAGVPLGATAAFVNLTTVNSAAPGYVTAYPCDRPRPHTSNLNHAYGGVAANAALAPLDPDGRLCLYTRAATDLIVDVTGYLTETGPPGPGSTTTTLAAATSTTGPPPTSTTTTSTSPVPVDWAAWATSANDAGRRLAPVGASAAAPDVVMTVGAPTGGAPWYGTGAALTDSSTLLLAGRPDLLDVLYDPDHALGAQLSLVRLPLSATDFSMSHWTWAWEAATATATPPTPALAAIDVVGELVTRRPDLRVVALPWSAPASMKTSGSTNGGGLVPGKESELAAMLAAQADVLLAAGVPLDAMSIVNEPNHSSTGYPTMTMTVAQMVAVAEELGPGLAADGIELWALDHNWKHRYQADALLDGSDQFARVAFHCYEETVPEAMAGLPEPAVVTECTGTNDGFVGTFRWDAVYLVERAVEAGSTGLIMWNLALDQDGGPKIPGGCAGCRGLVTVDDGTGEASFTPEFYTLAHLARAAVPGAAAHLVSGPGSVPAVAFANPDGSIGVFAFNDSSEPRTVQFATPLGSVTIAAGPYELITLRSTPGE